MTDLAKLIERVGERTPHDNYDFDIEDAVAFADFFNNGGLKFTGDVDKCYLVYAALKEDGRVEFGSWIVGLDEDFDTDAEWMILEEDDFSGGEIDRIYKRIKEIYEKED